MSFLNRKKTESEAETGPIQADVKITVDSSGVEKDGPAVSVPSNNKETDMQLSRRQRRTEIAIADLHASLALERNEVPSDSPRASFTHRAQAALEEIASFFNGTHECS
jgi:hypothetical protein